MRQHKRKALSKSHSRIGFLALIFCLVFMIAFSSASVSADDPTEVPTDPPTATTIVPTDAPTAAPTDVPTAATTAAPTDVPTDVPTATDPATPTDTATVVDTSTSTDTATVTDTTTATDTATSTDTATENATDTATATDTETVTSTLTVTDTPTATIVTPARRNSAALGSPSSIGPSCQMDINDAGDSDPYSYNFSAISTSGIASYSWDFGDSSGSTSKNASHSYSAPNTYNVTLTCTPTVGSDLVLNGSITISNPTVASFALTPGTTGLAPFTVNLVNTSTGSNLTYLWEVTGPETYSVTTENASFTFSTPGSYTITLTVHDNGGQSAAASAGVVVSVPPPLADFTLSPSIGAPPLDVTVQGVIDPSSGPITTWSWDFGDGSALFSGQFPPVHTYTIANTYAITLNYSGPNGNGMVMRQVVVSDPAVNVDAAFNYTLAGNDGAGIKVCFDNTSTGPVATSTWDFGDGSAKVVDNTAVVCHTFSSESSFEVTLEVAASDPTIMSSAKRTVTVVFAPVAHFTASATTLESGDTVNFDSTGSTGNPDTWAWDFNGDGTTDSTAQNPSNIPFTTIGGNTVKLTVSSAGGSSSAEMTLIVTRAAITCDFSGNLTPTPGTNALYDGVVTNLRGRGVTYTWTINGPQNFSFTTEDTTVNWATVGSYLVTFAAVTDDGASCSKAKTVQVAWPDLVCGISGNFTPSPNGSSYSYTANVSNLVGRTATYQWYIDNVLQPETGNTIARLWTVPTTSDVRVEVTTTDGSGSCNDSQTLNVQWPTLSCSISGNLSPLPQLPDNPTRTSTYTANLSGLDGRSVTYQWYVDGVPSGNSSTLTLLWAWNETGPYSVMLDVTADNNDATTTPCSNTVTVNVVVPSLICNAPSGDTTPSLDETVTYTRNVQNQFGRTIVAGSDTWELEKLDASNVWQTEATGTGASLAFKFIEPNAQYRIRYSISVTQPDDGCTSGWELINAPATGADFLCEAGPFGNFAPTSASANYTYSVTMDDTDAIPLQLTWVLVDSQGNRRILATNISSVDGTVNSPAISGAALGPADNYTLRVEVQEDPSDVPAVTTYNCALSAAIVVGTLHVDYTFTVNNNAVEVGQSICLNNVSNTSHGDINSLNYTWDFGSANNSLGTQTSNAQQPPCFSFPNPGTYNIKLTGTNASGLRTASKTYTFHVYGSQSLAINHSNQSIAPATMTFSAVGVNVSAPYSWTFRNVTTNTVVGTRIGQNVSFLFNTAGTYEATVSANGPLGTTTASGQFTLLAVDDIRAAFTPSSYNGNAPLSVCFTDRSVGNNINSWAWDFNNDGVIDSTQQNPCTTFTTPSTAYLVRLNIKNTSNKTATATNIIHTFNVLESHSTFTIIPQGSGLYCFQSQVDGSTTVTSWDFGDGNTVSTGNLSYVCHNYSSSGSYAVTMNITNGTTTGSVTRPVDVDLGPTPPTPTLSVNASCSLAGGATFTITNTGGSMVTPDSLTITDDSGTVIVVDDTLKLANGASKTYNVQNSYGTLTLKTVDTQLSVSTYCDHPPMLSGSALCLPDGSAQFIINNSSTDTDANQSYSIANGVGTVVKTGTINAAKGGSQTISVSGVYGVLNLTSSGSPAATSTLTISSNCAEPPVLTASALCQVDGSAVFTITNNSTDTPANQGYTITDATNTVVQTGTITAAANGGTQTITATGAYQNRPLTLTSSGGAQGATTVISVSQGCNQPPVLSGAASCTIAGSFFTITNNSAHLAANQSYTVTDATNTVIQTGTITAAANGGTQTISLNGVFGTLNFSTSGIPANTTTVTLSNNCQQPPVLSGSAVCQPDGSVVFTITNTSAHLAANQSYSITDATNVVVQTGAITAAANGGTQTITADKAYVNKPLTLTSNGGVQGPTTVISISRGCDEPPMLSGNAICLNSGASFTIFNKSADTDANQSYRILNSDSVIQTHTLTIPANSKININVTGVFGAITFITDSPTQGTTASLTVNITCADPSAVSVALSATLDATPLPAETAGGIPVNVTGETCSRGCIDLQVYHTNRNGHWDIYRMMNTPPGQPNQDINLTDTDGKYDNMAPSRSPNAEWIVFTSNRDGNWELYLAPTNGDTRQTRRLTFNQVAIDTDPVWGPNNFVVFETNRNGNWDLYLLDMTTGKFYALTTNKGNDVNPSWSNDGSHLVFQSDRSGKWQIYEMDMTTFQIRLLSDGKGSDMDPSYSEDNSRISFRTSRGNADSVIYIMGADGANPTPISNPAGYATNQSWSPNDQLIAYQSDLDGDLDVYVYDVGSKQTRKVTNNTIPDYAPTWRCATNQVIFTSDIGGSPDIYEAKPLPISDPGILVDKQADQITNSPMDDIYPEGSPVEENASREGRLPDLSGVLTGETVFLKPDVSIQPPDLSVDTATAWEDIGDTCSSSPSRDDLVHMTPPS